MQNSTSASNYFVTAVLESARTFKYAYGSALLASRISLQKRVFNWFEIFFSSTKKTPSPPRVFTLPENVRVYAVGDIHGKAELLKKMLAAIAEDAAQYPDKKILEVFLGDYIDRGLESRAVIDLLLSPSKHERICLMGNHEETLLRYLDDPKILREWGNYGGFATLTSYGVPIPQSTSPETFNIMRDAFKRNLPEAHLTFIKNLKMWHVVGDYLFVHAGIVPNIPLDLQQPQNLLWIRSPFLSHKDFFDYYVVHGHSAIPAPEIKHNRANVDISAAMKESLCCLVAEGNQRNTMIVK